jgi:Neu-associated kinase
LKVENLLLDNNKDLKLIDFGLSNEMYFADDSGTEVRCRTQCGSPAYAAPELLGHKEYDQSVDVWSIGVNMYAMLTGCLPFTVEPFNITALHAKMLQNKMNPIPNHISKGQ